MPTSTTPSAATLVVLAAAIVPAFGSAFTQRMTAPSFAPRLDTTTGPAGFSRLKLASKGPGPRLGGRGQAFIAPPAERTSSVALKSSPHISNDVAPAHTRTMWIGGNWKCNGDSKELGALINNLNSVRNAVKDDVEVVCSPPVPYLDWTRSLLRKDIDIGAQNVWLSTNGAYTGEYTADMLKDVGVNWVILGHSERRHLPELKESDDTIAMKTVQALKAGLKVVLCVGETLEERESGKTLSVITRQLLSVATRVPSKSFENIVIAYEPVWAIGTGKTATPDQAQDVHSYIRKWVSNAVGQEMADNIRIVYGGSVNPENAKELKGQTDIDGFLVGGASLKASSFLNIVDTSLKLKSSRVDKARAPATVPGQKPGIDWGALVRYVSATSVQFGLLASFLYGLDYVVAYYQADISTRFVALLFGFLSLRSRMFSIMDNSRPKPNKHDPVFQRKKPWWTPPPLTFPIVWSGVAVLRALSTTIAYVASGEKFFSVPLLAMVAHLSIGDTWNTINNVEKRMGTALLGVLAVLGSAAAVAYTYYLTHPLAGALLSPTVGWIAIATLLIGEIYRLNNKDGSISLLPRKGEATAKWRVPFTSFTK